MSFHEPSSEEIETELSSEEVETPTPQISWKFSSYFYTNPAWKIITDELGYPRPQGNLPMYLFLTDAKKRSLGMAYENVKGQ
jgi:hypothetical protein